MRFLHVIEGPDSGAIFALPDLEPQLIGRSTEALPIKDQSVSRRHAELTPDGANWFIRDLASTNGTLVNGKQVEDRTRLERGDTITCGSTILLFDSTPEGTIPIRALDEDRSSFNVLHEHGMTDQGNTALTGSGDGLDALLQGTRLALGMLDTTEYLRGFLDLLIETFGASHAVAIVPGRSGSGASSIEVRHLNSVHPHPVFLDRKLIAESRSRNNAMLVHEVREGSDDRWALVAPLGAGDESGGAIYLQLNEQERPERIKEDELVILHALVGQAAMTIERGRLLEELLTRSRLAAMGETVAAISHGIKNILQGLRGGADAVGLAIERDDLDMAGKGWAVLARNLDRIQALTMNMLGFARHRALEIEFTSIEGLAAEAAELLEPAMKRSEVGIDVKIPDDLPPIPIDSAAILQALLNMLSNAVDVSPPGSRIALEATYDPGDSLLRLDIIDSGSGIDESVRDKLFEPFVTTKGQRGTGLGLVVSRRIAERHGGTLECIRSGSTGTVMRLQLPTDASGKDPGDTDAPRPSADGETMPEFGPPEH